MDAETHYDALELQVIDQQGYEYIRAREGVSIDEDRVRFLRRTRTYELGRVPVASGVEEAALGEGRAGEVRWERQRDHLSVSESDEYEKLRPAQQREAVVDARKGHGRRVTERQRPSLPTGRRVVQVERSAPAHDGQAGAA